MTGVDNKNGQADLESPAVCRPPEPPNPDQLRLARANLLEALTVKFNNLFTTIVANCEMALMHLEGEHPAVEHLASAKRAAYQASDANGRVIALVKECREAHK
jgi:hypothetical protein